MSFLFWTISYLDWQPILPTPFPFKERHTKGELKRGFAPLLRFFPLSLEGEGDTGGKGDSNYQNPAG